MSEDKFKIKKEFQRLRKLIEHHDYRYYILSQPEVSDKEYDDLLHKLKSLEDKLPEYKTSDSPTQRVAGEILEGFKTVRHRIKMLSLDNTYSFAELKDWDKRVHKGLGSKVVEYVVELKIDGVSSSIIYKDGLFAQGATRGDGETGEDVTANIKTIKSVPLRLFDEPAPEFLDVRGEVYMELKDFQALNKEKEKNGEVLFANPRNASAGSLKLLAPNIVAKRRLKLFTHSLGVIEGLTLKTHWDFLEQAKKWGLRTNPHNKLCKDLDNVIDYCQKWQKDREKLDFEIDGVVVKVNSFEQQKKLGQTLKSPRWAVAYKFPAKQATTKIKDIVVQVGRTGVLTPVASLQPVECGGVTISHATLHNFDEIERLGVRIGDRVIIERAGEVIPKVVKVVESVRSGKEKKLRIPSQCPECGFKVMKEKAEEVAYRCVNPICPAQIERGLIHFASRTAMDIEGMGESVVAQLVKNKLVKDFADIYFLKKQDLLKLELFADKKAQNLISSVQKSKRQPLSRLIYALGIRHVGEKAAFVLADKFLSLQKLMQAKKEELQDIYEVGSVMAWSVVEFFKQLKTKALITRLKEAGLNFEQPKIEKAGKFSGKTFVFTGELSSLSRTDAEAKVRQFGGNASSSVSENIDFVVVGEKPGSKYSKAKALGIKIIDEKEFTELIK